MSTRWNVAGNPVFSTLRDLAEGTMWRERAKTRLGVRQSPEDELSEGHEAWH
jgi:hypothetical protein